MKIWDEIFARETQIWSKPDEKLAFLIERLFRRNIKNNYELDHRGGRQTLYLAKNNFEVVASDTSHIALRSTILKLIEGNLPPKLIEADMTKQPFRDSFFDTVIALGVLIHNTIPNIQQSIMDINRIMKEGGILFATFKSAENWQYSKSLQIEDGTIVLAEPDHAKRGQAYHPFTKGAVIELLKGFRILELEHQQYEDQLYHTELNMKYSIWSVLAEKKIQYSGIQIGRSSQTEKKDAVLIKANPLDYFLNESFVRDFIELNLSKLNLPEFKILNCEINPFKVSRKGGIAAIEFKLHLDSERNNQQPISKSIVGKWKRDGQGKQVFDLLQELWNKGFDRGEYDHLKLYEPIAYFPDYNLMMTSKASGIELEKLILKKDVDVDYGLLKTYVMQAAMWLVKLHSTQVTRGRMFMQMEEEKLNEWSQHLGWFYPDFAGKIHNMLSHILDTERSLDPKGFVVVHGDFHPLNIFVEGTDLTVIDFEKSCIFDPAFDLGYFISYLTMKKKRYNLSLDTESLQKCFIDKYTAAMSTEPLERMDLYKARSYLQHLHFRYWTLNKKVDPVYFEYWVNKAEECLERRL